MKLRNMTVGRRLAFGFGLLLILLLAGSSIGFWAARSLSASAVQVLETEPPMAEHASRARANANAMRRYEKDVFLSIDSSDAVKKYYQEWKKYSEHMTSRFNDMEKVATVQAEKDAIKAMRGELSSYSAGFNKVYEMIQSGQVKTAAEANKAIDQYKDAVRKMEETSAEIATAANKRLDAGKNSLISTSKWIATLILVLSLVSAAMAVAASVIIARGITGPLRKVVTGITEGADQVASASSQVSSASQALAEGASEQAASIEETSSSLEEMSSMTKQNADNASMADTLMKDSRQMVERANGSMKQLTISMDEITKASEETSKIIKTIDEIAFQTNLLALNAAVEAARAGEAGAGFAVVANEVRNLAMRAAEAAKNTSTLIEGTVKKVKDGSELVHRTNEAFSGVTASADKVAGLVSEIAAASGEQAQGIGQISKAVSEMDKVTQQNAANAEESASASEEMSAQAEQMKMVTVELSSMIGGGANAGSVEGPSSDFSRPKALLQKVASLKLSKGPAKRSVQADAPKGARPEEVIPLSDGDFKNF